MKKSLRGWEEHAEFYLKIANFYVANESTVRETASKFGVSKSVVHKIITVYLKKLNPSLYTRARRVADKNTAERHIRGGEATKRKFEALVRRK